MWIQRFIFHWKKTNFLYKLVLYVMAILALCHLGVVHKENNGASTRYVVSNGSELQEGNTYNASIGYMDDRQNIEVRPCQRSKLPTYLELRRRHARTSCMKFRHKLPGKWKSSTPTYGMVAKVRWDRKHSLVYCHVPKVASTTWSWYLLRGSGMSDEVIRSTDNVHILLGSQLPAPSREEQHRHDYNNSMKFVVSRHPYERLVSAYQNKISDVNNRRSQYRALQKEILNTYRPSWNRSDTKTVPTFTEFVNYITSGIETWLGQQNSEHAGRYASPDHHWLPITYICSPCQIQYDVFSKVDTMNEDINFLSTSCHMEGVFDKKMRLNSSPGGINKHYSPNKDTPKTDIKTTKSNEVESILNNRSIHSLGKNEKYYPKQNSNKNKYNSYRKYFSDLPKHLIDKLADIYKIDFTIFDYTIDL